MSILRRYTSKLESDESDVAKGIPVSSLQDFMQHFIKVGFGVQRLMLEQMYAIEVTVQEYADLEPRLALLAKWAGWRDVDKFSACTGVLTLALIKAVIRPPTVCALQLFLGVGGGWMHAPPPQC